MVFEEVVVDRILLEKNVNQKEKRTEYRTLE